ncbi:MAG: T9SS type A sorting domain-containing protein [Bacteroidia bacterium]
MKKLIFTFLLLIASIVTYGQGCAYSQDFENPITGISSVGNPGFVPDIQFYHDGIQSYHATYAAQDSAIATTADIDLTGMTYVKLKFWHICKLEFFDMGIIEVSNDGGANWTKLTVAQYQTNPPSNFGNQGNKFTEAAYTGWHPADTITPVDSSWWREETFDISSIVGSGSVTNAKIRFVAKDLNNNSMAGRAGWYIDQICVLAAPCELDEPTFTQAPPVLQGTIYSLGPYTLNAYVNDASGIAGVYLFWYLNGIPQPVIPMVNPLGDSLYTTQLPAVADSDTICYYFYAFDASACSNDIFYPGTPVDTATICFIASSGITFPYCDNFDVNNLWVDSLVSGSSWELGTPNFGLTNSPHSAPNSWDISLNTGYTTQTESYLISPVFDFGPASNSRMSFWYNCSTDNFSQDGVRLETSVNAGTWNILTIADDPSATNWYNIPSLGSSGTPGWGGNSGGWKEAKFNMSSFNNVGGVQLRFIFTSAFSTGDGFSIDDFCIIQPPPQDMGVDKVIEPFPSAGAGTISNAIVRVRNYGTSIQTTFDVAYSINGALQGTVSYAGPPLAPNDTAIVTITPTFAVPALYYDFCAWTILPSDADNTNDTLCEQHQGIPVVPLSYCNNFDVSAGDWTSIPSPIGNTVWELGTPAFGTTNSAFSNPNSWDINLTSAYENQADARLISPFFDFTGVANVDLNFWQNRNCEQFWDGTRIEYDVNGSGTWQLLGAIGQGVNWYVETINSSGLPAWDGNSNGWIKSSLNVSQFNNIGLVQMQFIFTSDFSVIWDGFSIDNFCLHVPQPIDVGVDSILLPTTNSGAGQIDSVRVRVRNFGSTSISAFDVVYVLDTGGTIFTSPPVAYNGPALAPNATWIMTIPPPITIPNGVFNLCAYTSLATDMDHTNDTTCKLCKGIPVLPLNYCENFDGAANDWTPVTIAGSSQWELGTPNFGVTTGAHSAPNAWDVNLNSGYTAGSNCELLSPYFDFTNAVNAKLSFWQNRNIQQFNGDGARMDIFDGNFWSTLGTFGDPLAANWYTIANIFTTNQPGWDGNSNGWIKSTYKLTNYNNAGLIQLKYVFRSSNFSAGDGISIDDFCIIIPPPIDVGVDSILTPTANSGALQNVDVTVRVRNFGSAPISAFDVVYVFDDGTGPVTSPPIAYTGPTLNPDDTATVTIPPQITVPSGLFSVCAYTSLATDMDHTNDTLCKTCKGIPVLALNYCENFDGASANDWTNINVGGTDNWELGTPNFGATTGAHSAPNAWDVNLNSGYTTSANCELLSPFFDLTPAVNAQLSFWQNRNTQAFNDGTRLDISDGTVWTTLGTVADPLATNWYTIANIFVSNQPAWDGSSNGWIKSTYQLINYNNSGLIQVKYVFRSTNFTNGDGMSIDDFCITIPPPRDAGAVSIDSPTGGLVIGNTYFPTVTIKNFGSAPIDSIPVTYTINGTIIATQLYPFQLLPNVTGQLTFTTGFAALSGGFDICAYTDLSADGDHSNDTTCTQAVGVPTFIPTYTDNFDGVNNGWTTNTLFPGTQWELGTPSYGTTSSSHSAPNCWDVNLASQYQNQANCELISPFFDFINVINAEVSFWLNINAEGNWDGVRLDYSGDGGSTWNIVGSIGCTSCLNWYGSTINSSGGLPAWNGNLGSWFFAKDSDLTFLNQNPLPVVFKFVFTSDFSVLWDGASVDDFMLYKPISITAATNLLYPANNILTPGPQNIVGRYLNKGTTPLTKVLLSLVIDGVLHVTDTIDPIPGGQLNLNASALHTFSLPWNASPGQHNLCIYTSSPNFTPDLDNGDDTTCTVLTVFDSTSIYPYCNGFESGPQWVALNSVNYTPTSSWQIGTPLKTNIVGAHSGANCWVTNLVSEYPNQDNSSLFSPVFNVEANKCYELSFFHNADMDLFNDGGIVEYTLDSAKTWTQLGEGGDYLNWYNSTYIAAFGGPTPHAGWTGSFGGWVQSIHNWPCTQTGQVIFRWRFASDQSNTADGWAIDDVCFKETPSPCITAIGEIPANGFYLYQNTPNPANGNTDIAFSLPKSGKAVMTITNLVGQIVAQPVNENLSEGRHAVDLNAKDFAPGIYYYTLKFDERKIVRKMVITK